jgi:16S rRNA (guanine527-N7)-methyltransferase
LVISCHLAADERLLDVGTGGGVPGIILAIVRPDLTVTLSESVAKRSRVVGEIVRELGLGVAVQHCRAEDLLGHQPFDTLVARAVAPLAKLLTWLAPHWGAFERLLAIKGPSWVEERHEARQRNLFKGLQLRKLDTWPLPGTHSESVLLEIRPEE